jgi:hypothetical protein
VRLLVREGLSRCSYRVHTDGYTLAIVSLKAPLAGCAPWLMTSHSPPLPSAWLELSWVVTNIAAASGLELFVLPTQSAARTASRCVRCSPRWSKRLSIHAGPSPQAAYILSKTHTPGLGRRVTARNCASLLLEGSSSGRESPTNAPLRTTFKPQSPAINFPSSPAPAPPVSPPHAGRRWRRKKTSTCSHMGSVTSCPTGCVKSRRSPAAPCLAYAAWAAENAIRTPSARGGGAGEGMVVLDTELMDAIVDWIQYLGKSTTVYYNDSLKGSI